MLSMTRLHGFLLGLLILFVVWRGGRVLWWLIAWSDGPPSRAPFAGSWGARR